jgi:hypothetical protein
MRVSLGHGLRKKGMYVTRRWNTEWLKNSGDPCGQPLYQLKKRENDNEGKTPEFLLNFCGAGENCKNCPSVFLACASIVTTVLVFQPENYPVYLSFTVSQH